MELVDLALAVPPGPVQRPAVVQWLAKHVGGNGGAKQRAEQLLDAGGVLVRAMPADRAAWLVDYAAANKLPLRRTVVGERVVAVDTQLDVIEIEWIRDTLRIGDDTQTVVDAPGAFAAELARRRYAGHGIADTSAQAVTTMAHVDIALEAAIADAAPADRKTAIMVYADWLQERGDVRGEYLALCAAGQGTERERELRAKLIDRFASEPRVQVRWNDGLVDQIDIVRSGDALHREELRVVLGDLLRLPIARLIRTLRNNFHDATSMVETLLAIGPPASLERLALGPRSGFDGRAIPTTADVKPLLERLPRLRELELCAHTLVLGAAPRLETARLIGEISDPLLCEVAGWRNLHSLYLGYCTSSEYGPSAEATPTGYRLLFDDPPPELTSLVLHRIPKFDEVCVELAASRLVKQLRTVELHVNYYGETAITDRGRNALAALGNKLTIKTP